MGLLCGRHGVALVASALVVVSLLACGGAATQPTGSSSEAAPTASAAPPQRPAPTVRSEAPADAEIPAGFPPTASPHAYFEDFSWRTFVALNWPAVEGKRGVPDTAKKLGDNAPGVVWESWKAAYELFQPGGEAPSAWDAYDAVSPAKEIAPANAGRVKQFVTFSPFGPVLEEFNQAGFPTPVGPLVAQNQTYVRYEGRINQLQYNFIRGDPQDPRTALYLRANLPPEGATPLRFPAGSVVVRAAWRELLLPQEKHLLDRYYHTEALLVDPGTRESTTKIMGLVGMHIVQKTPSRPQWIWSTFEHVDNVAVGPDPPPGTRPTFNDPAGPREGRDVNKLPPAVNRCNPPGEKPTPVQVCRLTPIPDTTRETNRLYQTHELVKNTVWKNYELVATQWPTQPGIGGTGKPFPANGVANVTMETEFQSISCMSCHGFTEHTDFMWSVSVRAHPRAQADVLRAVKALRDSRGK
jgi:hypothetical protein